MFVFFVGTGLRHRIAAENPNTKTDDNQTSYELENKAVFINETDYKTQKEKCNHRIEQVGCSSTKTGYKTVFPTVVKSTLNAQHPYRSQWNRNAQPDNNSFYESFNKHIHLNSGAKIEFYRTA